MPPFMGKNFKNLSLRHQTYLLLGGFMVLAIFNFFLIRGAHQSYTSFNEQLEEVNYLRDNVKRVKKWSIGAVEDSLLRDNALDGIEYIDNVLATLKHGGKLPNTKINIGEASSSMSSELIKIKSSWSDIKDAISIILFEPAKIDTTIQQSVLVQVNDSTTITEIQDKTISIDNNVYKKALNFIKLEYPEFELNIANLEGVLKNDQQEAEDWIYKILSFFLIFNTVSIIAVIIYLKNNLFVPLDQVGRLMSSEKFDEKSEYVRQNELGVITTSLNHLVDTFQRTTSFVRKIGEGNLDVEIEGLDKSEIREGSLQAALLNMRSQMKKMDEEEAERKWTTEGLAKFVEILRASDNVQQLSDQIISSLVEYTKSNQGGIYIINEEGENNKYLELISLYAFSNKKFETKSYRLGEGLVGQTYVEQKTIYLLDVPKDYIQIGSGLGDSNPTTILLVPLKIENNIYGVIELASFHEYYEYQIEFVEKLGESIASTIAEVKANQKTKQLLEESQQLTEQMQAQEEEMRQNMEELTATQEEMGRKELAVNAQIEAINRSLGLIEYSSEGEVINVNRKLQDALGRNEDSLLESDFYTLHGGINLFDELKDGKSWSGWLSKNHASGTEVEFKSYFNPVLGDSGELLKIIEIVTQFTREESLEGSPKDHWSELSEIEEEFHQQMEELEITQEQLNNKLSFATDVLSALKKSINIVILTNDGDILEISDRLSEAFPNASKFDDIFNSDLEHILETTNEITLEIKLPDIKNVSADKARIDENKILITWT